jgi:vanillate O-demethylase monooxygenase subunit
VPRYPAVERYRYVWVWIGEPEKADEALLPDFWPCEAQGWTFDGGYKHVACDYRLLIDNLMDLTHETYVHAGSIGQPELMETPIDTSIENDRVVVTRWLADVEAPPFWRNALKRSGRVNRWQICHFLEPSSVIIDVGVSPVEAGDTVASHDSGVRGFVIDAMTPETAQTTHYFWGMARDFDIRDAGVTGRMKAQQSGVFDEDVEVLELQQRSISANTDMRLRNLSIDAGGVHARRIIERLAAAS